MHQVRPGDEIAVDRISDPPVFYFIQTGRAVLVTAESSNTNTAPSDSSPEPEAEQEEHV